MIEIGKTRIVPVRRKGADGKLHTNGDTKIVQGDVWRQTRGALNGGYGRDRGRKLVVGLVAVDQLVIYPKGTRQEYRVNITDVYAWLVRNRALRAQLERARDRKNKLAVVRQRRRIAAADRRITRDAKKADDRQWMDLTVKGQ